jgi:hypothetical protein
MFTTYPYEKKGLVNVVNVARGFLVVTHATCQSGGRTDQNSSWGFW